MLPLPKTLCILSVICLSSPGWAGSMRCGTKLVSIGDTSTQVKYKCGKPFAVEDLGLIKQTDYKYAKLQRIIYKPARGKFLKVLEFHNGKLVKIDFGERI